MANNRLLESTQENSDEEQVCIAPNRIYNNRSYHKAMSVFGTCSMVFFFTSTFLLSLSAFASKKRREETLIAVGVFLLLAVLNASAASCIFFCGTKKKKELPGEQQIRFKKI